MRVDTWSLFGWGLLCAALAVLAGWRSVYRVWARRRHREQVEEANRLCQEYCGLVLRLKDDPFNLRLCQQFLATALAYYGGDASRELTAEVERSIRSDLLAAGVRRSALFGRDRDLPAATPPRPA